MLVVAMADSHAGHRLGLCNPAAVLIRIDDDGQAVEWRPELGAMQQYLWRLYSQHSAEAVRHAGDDEIIVIHDGDITHGVKHAEGLMDITGAEQAEIAAWNLMPSIISLFSKDCKPPRENRSLLSKCMTE